MMKRSCDVDRNDKKETSRKIFVEIYGRVVQNTPEHLSLYLVKFIHKIRFPPITYDSFGGVDVGGGVIFIFDSPILRINITFNRRLTQLFNTNHLFFFLANKCEIGRTKKNIRRTLIGKRRFNLPHRKPVYYRVYFKTDWQTYRLIETTFRFKLMFSKSGIPLRPTRPPLRLYVHRKVQSRPVLFDGAR